VECARGTNHATRWYRRADRCRASPGLRCGWSPAVRCRRSTRAAHRAPRGTTPVAERPAVRRTGRTGPACRVCMGRTGRTPRSCTVCMGRTPPAYPVCVGRAKRVKERQLGRARRARCAWDAPTGQGGATGPATRATRCAWDAPTDEGAGICVGHRARAHGTRQRMKERASASGTGRNSSRRERGPG
jgi:hypothetical protein